MDDPVRKNMNKKPQRLNFSLWLIALRIWLVICLDLAIKFQGKIKFALSIY